MGALTDGMVEITLDKPRKLLFDLNVMDAINEKFGDYRKLGEILSEGNPNIFKDIRYILTLLLNEAAEYQNYKAGQEVEPLLTEKVVGMLFNPAQLKNKDAIEAIYKAFNVGMVGNEAPETDDEDNPTTAATKSTM